MSKNSNKIKRVQLGMPHGTATNRLRKQIIFMLLWELRRLKCHRCGKQIGSAIELSIDHKEPWLNAPNPQERFFDLSNVAFSHLSCNSGAGKRYELQPNRWPQHKRA